MLNLRAKGSVLNLKTRRLYDLGYWTGLWHHRLVLLPISTVCGTEVTSFTWLNEVTRLKWLNECITSIFEISVRCKMIHCNYLHICLA
jgi:hypothetical protein